MGCEMPYKIGWETTTELRNLRCSDPIIVNTTYSGV